MMRLSRWPCLLSLALGIAAFGVAAFGIATPGFACTIPVFRYALERWDLSPYEVVVFHRGDLAAPTRRQLDALSGQANLVVTRVDLDGTLTPALRKLWARQGPAATLPWVVVRRPDEQGTAAPAWSGPLAAAALRELVDSPARQKIAAALGAGDAGVFILLLSGDRAADAAAASLLKDELGKLEKLVKLPEQSNEGPRIQLALPLKVAFTILPLRRDAPGESVFVRMLLASEDDLGDVRGPIVFPVFGRGRLLGSLYGKDLNTDTVFDVVSFLCGECSCQVKELNPGMDLLIAADWPAVFARIGPAPATGVETPLGATRHAARAKPLAGPLPFTPGTSKPADTEAAPVVRVALSDDPADSTMPVPDAPAPPEPVADAPHRRWLWRATLAAGVLVVVTGAWACRHGRRAVRRDGD